LGALLAIGLFQILDRIGEAYIVVWQIIELVKIGLIIFIDNFEIAKI
jgi:hypothetical protein